MNGFSVNTHRYEPYKNFKFRVMWDGRYVAGISKVSALKRSTEPATHRAGGDPTTQLSSPTTWKFEAITLERGLTHDPEFEAWANLVYSTEGDAAISLRNFRKNITIELLNQKGEVVRAYNVYRCWVSEYNALPELDANGNAFAIESIVLQNEGWEREDTVTEQMET